jgi:hypothetical protein
MLLQNETGAAHGVLELEQDHVNMERKQLTPKRSKLETTGLEVSTLEQCIMTSAVGLWEGTCEGVTGHGCR